MARKNIFIDFETTSACDLTKSGAWKYVEDPTTTVLCMAYAIDDGPIKTWRIGETFPKELEDAIADNATFHAWNAANFEFPVWNKLQHRFYSWPELLARDLRCTMTQAAYYGLPLSLDNAAMALGLAGKDKAGSLLMKQMSRPRDREKGTWWHIDDPAKLDRLIQYCEQDVRVEREIWKRLPPLPVREQELWELDLKMNAEGWLVDTDLVDKLDKIVSNEMQFLTEELIKISHGELTSPTQVAAMTEWVKKRVPKGVNVEGLAKDDVSSLLKLDLNQQVKDVLLIRKEASKSSTAKLKSIRASMCHDRAIRGLVQFYGASRTGRWAGRLVQVQNFPRPTIKGVEAAVRDVLDDADNDYLRLVYGPPMEVVSSLIRSVFIPPKNHVFLCPDFSQIEARVVAWLAGQDDILKVFASGEDVYTYTAKKIGSDNRQLGKVCVLGLGFGMGAKKFVDAAASYGITLSEQQAIDIVGDWRSSNMKIANLWWGSDRAARDAITKNTPQSAGRLLFYMGTGLLDKCLIMRLPSRRELVYRNARLELDATTGKTGIVFDGVNPITKKWGAQRTYGGKLVENATQATARDCMAEALLSLPTAVTPITSVHDELILKVRRYDADRFQKVVTKILSTPPLWASGLPVACDGKPMTRYGK